MEMAVLGEGVDTTRKASSGTKKAKRDAVGARQEQSCVFPLPSF